MIVTVADQLVMILLNGNINYRCQSTGMALLVLELLASWYLPVPLWFVTSYWFIISSGSASVICCLFTWA